MRLNHYSTAWELFPCLFEKLANAMKLYLVTHGERNGGYNPSLTPGGVGQADKVRDCQLPKIPRPKLVVVGTGARFEQMAKHMGLDEIPRQFSPLCGSGDALESGNTIAISTGRKVPANDYIGLAGTPGFDAWKFVSSFPGRTLFCAGAEMTQALGFSSERGCLYELNTDTKRASRII